MAEESHTVRARRDLKDGCLWAEVLDLPGVFAAGDDWDALGASLDEGIGFYLAGDDD